MRDGASHIRGEGHNNSLGPVFVPVLARVEQVLGDVAQNRVVTVSLNRDDPVVSELFGRLGLGRRLGGRLGVVVRGI